MSSSLAVVLLAKSKITFMNLPLEEYRKQRLELISLWKTSGLSPKEFCKKHNFPSHQFYYWLKIMKEMKPSSPAPAAGNFVSVKLPKVEQQAKAVPVLELVCPNGIQLKFYSPVNFSELRSLIK